MKLYGIIWKLCEIRILHEIKRITANNSPAVPQLA